MNTKIIGLFSIFLFVFNAPSHSEDYTILDGHLLIDVVMPFPGTPQKGQINVIDGMTVTSFRYSPQDTHINYAAMAYQEVPEIEDPASTILKGFTNRHNIIRSRNIEVKNHLGTYVKFEADIPRKAIWNVFAFEYKGNVYIWIETFEPYDEQGNEDENFLENLQNMRFK